MNTSGPQPEAEVYGPQFPSLQDLYLAQDAPCAANSAGCSDAVYDRLILERQQTEAAYLDGYDRDLARALDAEPEAPATAADVVAVIAGQLTGPEADAVLASYFAPGPEPRYHTLAAQAEAEAGAEADDPDPWAAPDYTEATQEEKEAFHEEMQRRCADPEPAAYGPEPASIHDVWAAQAAPHDANLAGCSDAVYERLVLQKLQTEVAYREARDRDRVRALEAEAEATWDEPDPWAAEYDVEPEAEI